MNIAPFLLCIINFFFHSLDYFPRTFKLPYFSNLEVSFESSTSYRADPDPIALFPFTATSKMCSISLCPLFWFFLSVHNDSLLNEVLLQKGATDFFMGLSNLSSIFLVTLGFSFRGTYSLDTISYFSKCSVNRVSFFPGSWDT